MLSGQGIVASQQPQTPTAVATADSVSQQLNNWLDMNKAASSTQQPQQQSAAAIAHAMQARPSVDMPGSSAMPATATPASLMNLPSSAHHLPHTSTGEIVTSDATSSVAIATVFGQQQQHQQQQTTSTGQPFLSSTAVSAPTSASAAAAAAVAAMIATTSVAGTPATLAGSASGTMHQQFDTSNSTSSIPIMTPLLQFATQSAPMTEFVHPPMPPPLQIGPSLGAGTSERSGGRQGSVTFIKPASVDEPHTDGRKRGRRKSTASATTAAAAQRQAASSSKSANPRSKPDSKRGRRRSRPSLIISPRATPLVPSILKNVTSPGISPLTGPMISPAIAPLTPAIAPLHRRQSNSGERPIAAAATPVLAPSTSGGGGGSTTVTPRMGPKTPIIAATSTTNIVGLEADVVTRLATKSNYQNILEGNSELLGLKYHTEFKSGLEKRRTNHKQAEQKRRDSLKLCFYDLKTRLPDLNPKLVSKIYLLNEANAFIDSQKSLIERQARIIELLSNALIERDVDVAAITAPIIKEEEEEKKRRQEAKEAKEQEAEEERGEQQAEDMDIE
ncbi:hypothetical protein GQ54DRAFT_313633 [Martensiomyces pterosporus]|nr:hypothetical protein GQ54DRAFT_313633 [Martensiomyces pterosporus]